MRESAERSQAGTERQQQSQQRSGTQPIADAPDEIGMELHTEETREVASQTSHPEDEVAKNPGVSGTLTTPTIPLTAPSR